jgi:uncharacterized protein (DUF952 family)
MLSETSRTESMFAPKYIFKVVTSQPDLHSEKIQLTELDKESGFIRLSSGRQIPDTCNLFFSSAKELYIIRFPYDKLKTNIKWEPSPDDVLRCAHLYGELWTVDVDSMRKFDRGDETWVDALAAEQWLLEGVE